MKQELKISLALSFVSGFVDSAGFIALFGLFTAHVTGNLVLAGASFFNHNNGGNLAAKLLMLPVFVIVVMFSSYLIKYRKATLPQLMLIESLFIACFSILGGLLIYKKTVGSNVVILLVASFAVIGMAIQNTYMRKMLKHFTPNTVMTGNLTQFSIDLFDLSVYFFKKKQSLHKEAIQPVFCSFKKITIALLGFLVGCFFGAFLVNRVGLFCCLLPAVILLWVRINIDTNVLYKV